ncbi:MAG: hypothetical protein IPN71_02350 [Fibrobacteres bacterium]|nr:hypothetical protein [Fibrobacterota bacterium]
MHLLGPLCAGDPLGQLLAVSAAAQSVPKVKKPKWMERTNGSDTVRFCFAQRSSNGTWEDPAAYRGVENFQRRVMGKTKYVPFAWRGYSGRINCKEDFDAPLYAAVRDSFVAISFFSFWNSIQVQLDSGGRVVVSLSGERRCRFPAEHPDACAAETILMLSGRRIFRVSGSNGDGKNPFEIIVQDGRVLPGNPQSRWPCR